MSDARVSIVVNGRQLSCPAGISVAAALLNAGTVAFRRSVTGEPRAPLCGMGTCYECRVTIQGHAHMRACMIDVADGMTVDTDAPIG